MHIESRYLIGRNEIQATVRIASDEGVHMVLLRRLNSGGTFKAFEIETRDSGVMPLSNADWRALCEAAAELANS